MVTVGINYCKEDNLDEIMPCKQNDNNLAAVTVVGKLGHIKVVKEWTECSVDRNQMY